MGKNQRRTYGLALACEGIGKLRAAEQFIDTAPDDYAENRLDAIEALEEFSGRVNELETWILHNSALAR